MVDRIEFGQRMKECREEARISVGEMSLLLNCGQDYIGKLERGDRLPSLRKLCTIAEATNTSLDYLLYGNENGAGSIESDFLEEIIRIVEEYMKWKKQ